MVLNREDILKRTLSSKDGRFQARIATQEDAPEIVEVLWNGFQYDQPVINNLYRGFDQEQTRPGVAEKVRIGMSDTSYYYVVIIDLENGNRIAGQGRWMVKYGDLDLVTLKGDVWGDDDQREYTQLLVRTFFSRRTRLINSLSGPTFGIGSLCVRPEYRGKGVGSLWIQWGLSLADQEGSTTLVESTTNAVEFYESHGFRRHELVDCNKEIEKALPGWQPRERPQLFWWMTRPPSSPTTNGSADATQVA